MIATNTGCDTRIHIHIHASQHSHNHISKDKLLQLMEDRRFGYAFVVLGLFYFDSILPRVVLGAWMCCRFVWMLLFLLLHEGVNFLLCALFFWYFLCVLWLLDKCFDLIRNMVDFIIWQQIVFFFFKFSGIVNKVWADSNFLKWIFVAFS